jgi:MFS family permease
VDAEGRFRRNMLLLWSGQFVSATGDALFLMAVAWMAGRVGGSAASVGFAVFLGALPFLVFGLPAGAWVDRGDRRRIMIASDLARAALLLSLPWIAAWVGGVSYALVAVTAFLVATFSTPFLPARDALLPDLAGGRSLARWNAVVQTSWQVAQILGLVLGGLLLAQAGPGTGAEIDRVLAVLRYDGATFLVSALALTWIVTPRRTTPPPSVSFAAEVRGGARDAWNDSVVRVLLVLTALNNLFLMGPAIVGPTLLFQGEFDLTAGHLAWFEGAMALGMLIGASWIALRGKRISPARLLLWGMLLDGLTYLPFLWLPTYPLLIAAIIVHGLFIPLIVVGRTSLLQAYVPDARRGKVFALVGLTVSGMTALSAVGSGLLAAWVGPRGLFGVAGGFGALCGLYGLLRLRTRLEAAGRPAPREGATVAVR